MRTLPCTDLPSSHNLGVNSFSPILEPIISSPSVTNYPHLRIRIASPPFSRGRIQKARTVLPEEHEIIRVHGQGRVASTVQHSTVRIVAIVDVPFCHRAIVYKMHTKVVYIKINLKYYDLYKLSSHCPYLCERTRVSSAHTLLHALTR
jgi:hypothetical protein